MRRGRPVLVWVIVIFQGFGIVGGIFSNLAALSGHPIGGEAARPLAQSLTAVDYLLALVVAVIQIAATYSLFKVKRRAFALMGLVLLIGIAGLAFNVALRPAYRAMFEQTGIWPLALGWGINLAIFVYIWRLRVNGTLRA